MQSPGISRSLLPTWQGCSQAALAGGNPMRAGRETFLLLLPPSLSRGVVGVFRAGCHHEGLVTQSPEPATASPRGHVALGALAQKAPWPCPQPPTSHPTASQIVLSCTGTVPPSPPRSPPAGRAPAVSPRERAVRRSTKQLQLIKGLNGVSERSWELATSINSSPCRAA